MTEWLTQAVGGAAGRHGSVGQGLGGGIYIESLAAAGGMDTDINGNSASSSGDDVFGVFDTKC
jgi:hypothetical protein